MIQRFIVYALSILLVSSCGVVGEYKADRPSTVSNSVVSRSFGGSPSLYVQSSTDLANVTSPHNITLPATCPKGAFLGCFGVFDGGSTGYTWDDVTAGVWKDGYIDGYNLVEYPSDFTNAIWTTAKLTKVSASRLEETAETGGHWVKQVVKLTSGVPTWVSIDIQADQVTQALIQAWDGVTNHEYRFNIGGALISTTGSSLTGSVFITGTVVRHYMKFTPTSTGNHDIYIQTMQGESSSYAGTAGNGMDIFQVNVATQHSDLFGDSELNEQRSFFRYKEADGTEAGLVLSLSTSGSEEMAAHCFCAPGWDSRLGIVVDSTNTDTSTPTPPAVTPSWRADTPVTYVAVAHADLVGLSGTSYPTGYSDNQYSVLTVGTGGVGQAFATKSVATTSTETPSAFTFTASDGTIAYILALPGFKDFTLPYEVCGSGIDENSGQVQPCPTGYAEAAVGGGCDLLCDTDDKDNDGRISSEDCDDTNPLIYEGYGRACGTDGTQVCQSDGTWSSCVEGELCEATGSGVCYYIDPKKGVNTSAGTTRATALRDYGRFDWGGAVTPKINLNPGDVVYQLDGTVATSYSNRVAYIRLRDGTEANPITIKPYPGSWGKALIDPNHTTLGQVGLYIQDSDYVNIVGLDIADTYGPAIQYAGTSVGGVVSRVVIHDVDGSENNNNTGVEIKGVTDGAIENSFLYDNYDTVDDGQNNTNLVLYNGTGVSILRNRSFFTDSAVAGTTTASLLKYKHAETSAAATTLFDGNMLFQVGGNAIETSQAGSTVKNNLVINANFGVKLGDLGGAFYPVNFYSHNNTFINAKAVLVDFSAYDSAPSSIVFRDNIIIDDDAVDYNNDVTMVSIDHYGSEADYNASVGAGVLNIDKNCYYNASQEFEATVFGWTGAVGGVAYDNFAAWKGDGYDTNGYQEDPSLDSSLEATSINCSGKGRGFLPSALAASFPEYSRYIDGFGYQ